MPTTGEIAGRFQALKALCEETCPATPEQVAEYRTLYARQVARDDARRAGQNPQASLPLDEAA